MRNRYKHTTTLEERLLKAAEDLRAKAKELLPGKDRDTLLEKARQSRTRFPRTNYSCHLRASMGNHLNPRAKSPTPTAR